MALAYKVATLAFDSTTPPKATFYRTYFWKKKNVNQTARVVVGRIREILDIRLFKNHKIQNKAPYLQKHLINTKPTTDGEISQNL